LRIQSKDTSIVSRFLRMQLKECILLCTPIHQMFMSCNTQDKQHVLRTSLLQDAMSVKRRKQSAMRDMFHRRRLMTVVGRERDEGEPLHPYCTAPNSPDVRSYTSPRCPTHTDPDTVVLIGRSRTFG